MLSQPFASKYLPGPHPGKGLTNPVAITQSLCRLGAWVPSLCLHHLAGLHPGPGVWRGRPRGQLGAGRWSWGVSGALSLKSPLCPSRMEGAGVPSRPFSPIPLQLAQDGAVAPCIQGGSSPLGEQRGRRSRGGHRLALLALSHGADTDLEDSLPGSMSPCHTAVIKTAHKRADTCVDRTEHRALK